MSPAPSRPARPQWARATVATLAAVVDLVLPQECAGCGDPGTPWCGACSRELLATRPVTDDDRPDAGALLVTPARRVRGSPPPTWAACAYAGVVAALVTAYKDGDRRDLARVAAGPLARAMSEALAALAARRPESVGRGVLLVTVPSSRRARRRRGDRPLDVLARAAARRVDPTGGPGLVWAPVLRHVRPVADQAALGRAARRENLAGALAVRPGVALAGRVVLLVDDVLTTGATLAEATRALTAAGALDVVGAVVAATPPATATLPPFARDDLPRSAFVDYRLPMGPGRRSGVPRHPPGAERDRVEGLRRPGPEGAARDARRR